MLIPFAVQTLSPGSQGPEFVIVGAEDPMQALAAAAKQCVDTGKEDTQLVAVFTRQDLDKLVEQMVAAEGTLSKQE